MFCELSIKTMGQYIILLCFTIYIGFRVLTLTLVYI
jgi:hypothetical protein